jgi:hypothetical protein
MRRRAFEILYINQFSQSEDRIDARSTRIVWRHEIKHNNYNLLSLSPICYDLASATTCIYFRVLLCRYYYELLIIAIAPRRFIYDERDSHHEQIYVNVILLYFYCLLILNIVKNMSQK